MRARLPPAAMGLVAHAASAGAVRRETGVGHPHNDGAHQLGDELRVVADDIRRSSSDDPRRRV